MPRLTEQLITAKVTLETIYRVLLYEIKTFIRALVGTISITALAKGSKQVAS